MWSSSTSHSLINYCYQAIFIRSPSYSPINSTNWRRLFTGCLMNCWKKKILMNRPSGYWIRSFNICSIASICSWLSQQAQLRTRKKQMIKVTNTLRILFVSITSNTWLSSSTKRTAAGLASSIRASKIAMSVSVLNSLSLLSFLNSTLASE